MASKKNYPSSSPRFMPISPPGQREYRKLTMREEILRVLLLMGAMIFCGFAIVILLYLDIAIIGPDLGVLVGLIAIIFLAKFIPWDHENKQLVIAFTIPFIILTTLWLFYGYDICVSFWVVPILTILHPFARIAILVLSIGSKAIFSWGMYILWIEMTDPNWPSPRQAVLRDGPYIPGFSAETYGGQVLPAISTLSNLPSRTITVQLEKDTNGKHTESVAHIPDLANWHQFFYAVAHHGKGFTEATAKAYDVPLADTRDQAGQLITIGMRTLREQFLARGWLKWKNVNVHERGLDITDKGMRILEAIGEEG